MADFDKACTKLFLKEGGAQITNYSNDRGGLTKYGISQKAYPNLDIRQLTEQQAKAIYKRDYFDRLDLAEEPSQALAEAVFECAVNAGVKTAERLRQLSQNLPDLEGQKLLYFKFLQIMRYRDICNKNFSQKSFLLGWLNRVLTDN